jgi:hypothetical protein
MGYKLSTSDLKKDKLMCTAAVVQHLHSSLHLKISLSLSPSLSLSGYKWGFANNNKSRRVLERESAETRN